MGVTRLILVRHGETDWNRHGIWQGTADVPLNARGREQAAALAASLAGVRVDAAYSSPLARARETAERVVEGRSLSVAVHPDLREISYGLWQGKGPAARTRCHPGLERIWRADPWRVRFPGGETLEEVSARACAAVAAIIARHPGEAVLISGHGHLNRLILLHFGGRPREDFWEIRQPNGGWDLLEVGRGTAGKE